MVTENMFKRILQNGDTGSREWLIYSPSIRCLFCFVCKLFGKSKSALADKGFDDWKHAGVRLREHEHSSEHTSAMLAFRSRRKKTEMIDKSLQIQFDNEVKYWHNVLQRVVQVITFLSDVIDEFANAKAVFRNRLYVLINFLLCVILPVHCLRVYKVSVLHYLCIISVYMYMYMYDGLNSS